jgi:hypothetical protein
MRRIGDQFTLSTFVQSVAIAATAGSILKPILAGDERTVKPDASPTDTAWLVSKYEFAGRPRFRRNSLRETDTTRGVRLE